MKVVVTSFPFLKNILACIEENVPASVSIELTARQSKQLGMHFPEDGTILQVVRITMNVMFTRMSVGSSWLDCPDAYITSGVKGLQQRRISFSSEKGTRNVTSAYLKA